MICDFCALQVLQVASLSNETLEVTNEELHKLQGGGKRGENSQKMGQSNRKRWEKTTLRAGTKRKS